MDQAFKEACTAGRHFTQVCFRADGIWRFTGFDWVRH